MVTLDRGAGAIGSTLPGQGRDGPSNGTAPLHFSPRELELRVIPPHVGAELFRRFHYLRSPAAGVKLTFGVFADGILRGALCLNAGPISAYRLVRGARPEDTMSLARLWLDDSLPKNSESRVLGVLVHVLRRFTSVKFVTAYADPGAGHIGAVYQAAGWTYTGRAEAQPLMDLGDGVPRHTRSIASIAGTHSAAYFRRHGLRPTLTATIPKFRYIAFVDRRWADRLAVPALPYPKKEALPHGAA
jgi:hypothetical protein